MNKNLLALAALAAMAIPSISAKTVVDVDQNYVGLEKFPYYVMDFEPEAKNDVLVVANPEAIENYKVQYFVCYDFNATKDVETEYTVTASIKSDADGDIVVVLGNWDPAARPEGKLNIKKSDDFVDYTTTIKGVDAEKCFVIFQSGALVGTYEIKSVKVTHEETGETPEQPEQPEQPEGVVNSWYTGNGQTFGGWGGATFENVEEDGKPCLKVTNAAAKENPWDIQAGLDVTLEFDKTYYISFDIKGTPAEGLGAGIQNSTDYSGKGNFTTFNITEAWNHAVIEATCTQAEGSESPANRITFNLGKYEGTFFMTNVVLSTTKPAGLDAVEVAPVVNHWTVYNLMGVKVLDTDNEAAVNELANGIYVINGKKVAIRK